MSKKNKKNKKDELLKNKKEDAPFLKEIIEFDDSESELLQDIPTKEIKKKK